MSSMSGFVTYVNYVAGTTKGETEVEDLFNNPFMLGDVAADGTRKDHIDANYTAARVVESFTGANAPVTAAWSPVYTGDAADAQARIVSITANDGTAVAVADDASVTVAADGKTLTLSNGTGTAITATDTVKVAYVYDNIVIPQEKLPTIKAEMKSIPLIAKARRIAIYYSQIAAFQSKTDYGLDLGDQLAQQAVGRLQYEIDTEVTDLLIDMADANGLDADMTWSKTLPVGVSKAEHYFGFTEVVEIAKQKIYDVTKRLTSFIG